MSNLASYVVDATGRKYLYQVSDDTPEIRAQFRKHAAWWKRTGWKNAPRDTWPAFPCKIVFEPC